MIETARKHRTKIGKVYAGRNGIMGAKDDAAWYDTLEWLYGGPKARSPSNAPARIGTSVRP